MSSSASSSFTRKQLLYLLLLSPFCAHAIVIAQGMRGESLAEYTWIDWSMLGLTSALVILMLVMLRWRKWLPQFTLMVWAFALTVGLLEAGLWSVYPPVPADIPRPPLHFAADVGDALPGCRGVVEFSVNDLGLRAPQADLEDFDLRLLCVGGSTTECRYVTDEESWPWRFQDQLAKCLGRSVFVGNAGISGQAALHHEYLIRHYEPVSQFDWVIVMCGTNDAALHVDSRRYRDVAFDIREGGGTPLTPGFGADPPLCFYYRRSCIARLLYRLTNRPRGVVQDPEGQWVVKERELRQRLLKTNPITTPPADLERSLDLYRSDLLGVIDACRDRGVKLMMLTQPTLDHEGMPPELEALLYSVIYPYHGYAADEDGSNDTLAAYPAGINGDVIGAYNQVMKQVCAAQHIPCIDLANELPQDTTIFYTDWHFNISGCAKIATLLENFFCEELRTADDSGKTNEHPPIRSDEHAS